jgi:hypothetical protein
MAHLCCPLRRQHAGNWDEPSANNAGAITMKVIVSSRNIAETRFKAQL